MAQEVILAEQTLEFSINSTYNLYLAYISPAPFTLVVGKTYTVHWDGEVFTCVAIDGSSLVSGAVFIGDASGFGLSGNGEPFIIGGDATSGINFMSLTDTEATSHTVAIYTADESTEDDPNDAVILSYSKNPDRYEKVPKVWLTHPSSTEEAPVLVPFTYGEAVGKTVEPDFSEGDMAVEIADGELVNELTITKPENLVPEHIKKGETIAGVPGEFIGDTEEVTVELSMADGDQVIEPSAEEKVLSKVIIKKPETLVPENIPVGIIIGGVEGAREEGGGGDGDMAGLITRVITEYTSDIASVGDYAFYKCTALTKVDLPNLSKIGEYGFAYCSALSEINAPILYELSHRAFYNCTALKEVDVSKIHSVGAYAFYGCTGITTLDFGTAIDSVIGALAFDTRAAVNIIIRNTTMIPDASSQYSYLFGMTTQKLFVPRTLVSTWKASNYMKAYHSNQVFAIEDYPGICG